ncbi:MAG: glycosyltransferase [Bacteroidota bacterium]
MHKTTEQQNFHVVYLGECGFPFGLANIQRMKLLSKALLDAGAEVTVINRKGKFDPSEQIDLPVEGQHEGIGYVYTSGSIYRPAGFWARNIQKVRGLWREFWYLRQLRREGCLQAGIISCYHLGQVVLYRFYSLLLGFPVAYNYVEWASAMQHRRSWKERINDYVFDHWVVRSMDGAMSISEVLMKNFQKIAPTKAQLKVPIICDFDKFNRPKKAVDHPYFLYCGALVYREVIDFLLEAFDQLPNESQAHLHLVLGGGDQNDYASLQQAIGQCQKADRIHLLHNVPHDEIADHYLPALALLIPLRPSLQDAARFPHKIGEYVATGNPMISTNFGEVAYYFRDEESALIAEGYEVDQFAAKMQFVLDHPEKARAIGQRGKALGLREFNYTSYGHPIKKFLHQLQRKAS